MSENDFQNVIGLHNQGERIFNEVRTVEQARAYILQLVEQVEQARVGCNIRVPGDNVTTEKLQRKAFVSWMIRYGQALGALTTLMHCRVLNDAAYEELRRRVNETAIPTLVGEVH